MAANDNSSRGTSSEQSQSGSAADVNSQAGQQQTPNSNAAAGGDATTAGGAGGVSNSNNANTDNNASGNNAPAQVGGIETFLSNDSQQNSGAIDSAAKANADAAAEEENTSAVVGVDQSAGGGIGAGSEIGSGGKGGVDAGFSTESTGLSNGLGLSFGNQGLVNNGLSIGFGNQAAPDAGLLTAVPGGLIGGDTFITPVGATFSSPTNFTIVPHLAANLVITKTDNVNAVLISGQQITYNITVTNTGNASANNVVVTDVLPQQGFTNINISNLPAGATYDANSNTFNLGSLAPGVTDTISITGTISSSATGTLYTNTATVTSSGSPVVTTSDPHTLIQQANLSLTNTDFTDHVVAGQTNTYHITISNVGLSDAYNVVVTDMLPAQGFLNIASTNLPAGVTFNAATDSWSINTLVAGASETLSITGSISGSLTGSSYANTVIATASDASTVTATDTDQLSQQADLSVNFISTPGNAVPGQATTESYSLQITNNGPSTVTSMSLTDSFMSQLTNAHFTLPAGSSYNATTGVLSGISLAAGQSLDFGVSGTYTPAANATGSVTDSVTVEPLNMTDPVQSNNTATTSNIMLNPAADLAVSFASAPQSATPGAATAENYSLQVTNNGPSTVTSITLADSFMSQLTNAHFTLPAGSSYNATTGVLSGISLASGQSLNFGVSGTYTPSANATGSVVDTATVSDPSGVTDSNLANNSASSSIALNPAADLAVSFASAPQSATPGQATAENYSLQVTNNGPSTVTSITLADSFMSQLTNAHFTLPAGSSYNATTGVLSGISLASGQSLNFGVSGTYTPSASATGSVVDTATVSDPSGVTDSNLANNSASSSIALNPAADLAVSFASAPQSATPGAATAENYSLQVTNNGPSTVTSITLSDSFMSQLTNAHFTLPAGSSYNATTGVLSGFH